MTFSDFMTALGNAAYTASSPSRIGDRVASLFDSDIAPTESELTAQADGNRERADLYAANSTLSAGFRGEYAPQVLGPVMESFHDMSHSRIMQFVDSIDVGQMSTSIDGWNQLADDTTTKATAFHDSIQREMERGWAGSAATQALANTRQYLADIHRVDQAARLIANKMAEARSGFQQVKYSVPHESESQTGSKMGLVVSYLMPGTPVLMDSAATARAEAAQAAAREVMNTVYKPVAVQSDTQVPKVPAPAKAPSGQPTDDGTQRRSTDNGSTTDGSVNGTTNGTTPGDPNATTPSEQATTTPGDDTGTDGDTTSSSATPSTTPETTTPSTDDTTAASTTAPGGTAPGGTTPGSGPGGTSTGGPGGGGPSGPSAPGAGQALPGGGTQNPRAGTTTTAGTAAGRTGMPGMMGAPGARAGKDDEDEHKAPDYLRGVHEELLGPDRPQVPPVIGGDA
ncbi:hypothetical protein [Nocardia rhizosphaerae]|uniref:PPE family protein n=1 Tax=Nocardia rhizosphaerae TaxID=1691571 RepID=A0ABV8L2E4_9NOCA